MIEQYLKYLENICVGNVEALKHISYYKVASANELDLENYLYSKLYHDLKIDIVSYNVFIKREKIHSLLDE